MNFKTYPYYLIFALLTASCAPGKKESALVVEKSPATVEQSESNFLINSAGDTIFTGVFILAEGRKINPDSVAKPKTVPVKGRPKVSPTHTNVHPVGEPKVVPVPDSLESILSKAQQT